MPGTRAAMLEPAGPEAFGGSSSSSRRLSLSSSRSLTLPEDPQKAAQEYVKLRQYCRDAFENFLRNLNLKSLHNLESEFKRSGGDLDSQAFMKIFTRAFPEPISQRSLDREQRRYVQQLACLMLFESMDVDSGGTASWMEFVEFVCAIAEELRMQAAEESGQTFEFSLAEKVAVPFRPAVTKCHFDRVFYWPEHPSDCAIVFEEGQPAFHLHSCRSLTRKRRVDGGHRQELLSATFMPAPFQWIVTSGNDCMVCFWDDNFNLVKRWALDQVWSGVPATSTSMGALCWCQEINALYGADHFSEKIRAWRITDPTYLRASDTAFKPDKQLDLQRMDCKHSKAVQALCWMGPLKSLATASLDTSVQIFDLVEMKRTHTLQQHKRGLTSLQYCPKNAMLLSAGFDNYISIWDPVSGTLSFTLQGHECSIAGVAPMPGTDFEFVSVDFDGEVRLWDVRRLVCVQSFHATDRLAEKNSELEALEPRAICPVGPNRVLVSGRRMVVFDREASNPRVTADWPINAIAFNERRIEIVTPIKNDLYVWCAITGVLRCVHDNVIEGTITAITVGLCQRRLFVGADDGQIHVVNYACAALFKKLQSHAYEVTQITCIPEKLLTLSTPEKIIMVHDDTKQDRCVVLKRIDLSGAGVVGQFAHCGDILAVACEDSTVIWYNMGFAKQVSSSDSCDVSHKTAVSCCTYFRDAPLMLSGDAEGSVIFWSMPPLRMYSFFRKAKLQFGDAPAGSMGVTCLALSYPAQDFLHVGSERGVLACFCIQRIVDNANALQKEILRRKDSGEAAEVISGRIFDVMPKPCDSQEYVFVLASHWTVERAHRGSVERVLVCQRKLPVVISLGSDACVRIWSHDTGEALGTLEQGLPEGLSYNRETTWLFPMDAYEEMQRDLEAISGAVAGQEEENGSSTGVTPREKDRAPSSPAQALQPPKMLKSSSSPNLRGAVAPAGAGGSAAAGAPPSPADSARRISAGGQGRSGHKSVTNLAATGGVVALGGSKAGARLQVAAQKGPPAAEDWYAGPYSPSFFQMRSPLLPPMGLPRLQSGMARPKFSKGKDVVAAARRLSNALGDFDARGKRDFH